MRNMLKNFSKSIMIICIVIIMLSGTLAFAFAESLSPSKNADPIYSKTMSNYNKIINNPKKVIPNFEEWDECPCTQCDESNVCEHENTCKHCGSCLDCEEGKPCSVCCSDNFPCDDCCCLRCGEQCPVCGDCLNCGDNPNNCQDCCDEGRKCGECCDCHDVYCPTCGECMLCTDNPCQDCCQPNNRCGECYTCNPIVLSATAKIYNGNQQDFENTVEKEAGGQVLCYFISKASLDAIQEK